MRPVIRLSLGTAARLGLARLKADAAPATAYLLRGESCRRDCAFCPQARGAGEQAGRLGRVTWPAFPRGAVLEGLQRAAAGFERICLQAVRERGGLAALLGLIEEIKACSALPLSVSAMVESAGEAAALLEAGAERISIALDAVNHAAHTRYRGGSLERRFNLLLECARRFPGRVSTHIICGLGETEEELLAATAALCAAGVTVALFAFTPLKGTRLAGHPPPDPASYRRLQAASFLLRRGLVRFAGLKFRQGKLVSFGLDPAEAARCLAGGEAFRTAGCPGCNRPYYNERPGGFIYNYPRPLSAAEAEAALRLALPREAEARLGLA